MSTAIKERAEKLETQLSESAFRRGTSAFRLGLVPMGISDHLPIEITLRSSQGQSLSMISWNLLSDDHLYNNFMNISGGKLLLKAKRQKMPAGCCYADNGRDQMKHFFSEIAQYLYAQQIRGLITVNREVLQKFISLNSQPSRLARSRSSDKLAEKRRHVESSRAHLVAMLLDEQHPQAHEFKLAIRHCLELIHHIKSDKGALKWANRYKSLKENKG